ncbi:MAG TPA: hydroxyisourate hydrolase [Candidatus Acidoferrales bacterium]|jgi:5-hydroxyisourate hydrolase|nr:hydroxyisourate hydrolase [Candidatus Acidoferrales bacterium]
MSAITTHVLDTSIGRPGGGIRVQLHRKSGEDWKLIGESRTDANGRCANLMAHEKAETGTYRLLFFPANYFHDRNSETFYSEIPIIFEVGDSDQHYHVPLLISPFGYSTYRGS